MQAPLPAAGAEQQQFFRGDAEGDAVKGRFFEFVCTFCRRRQEEDGDTGAQEGGAGEVEVYVYREQVASMLQEDRTTLFVDFRDVLEADSELAEVLESLFHRFEGFLRAAVQDYIAREHTDYLADVEKDGNREFFVAFYAMPRVERIRQLRTDRIGHLLSVSGTVTRSTEVRPELFIGHFQCRKCGTIHNRVEQQFQYTPPAVCANPQCSNTNDFLLDKEQSVFLDWQRLRVQENADEIPPGSMPRSVDVLLRNDIVEKAKAGDKVIFTGTVIVLSDVGGLARAGEAPVSTRSSGMGERVEGNADGGVSGFKRFGVKELTYRIAFVACAVHSANADLRVGRGLMSVLDEEAEDQNVLDSMTQEEKRNVLRVRNTPNFYNRIVDSVAPSVFGHKEIKRGILLQLLGGVSKVTRDGISLRGDINVCIVGDPSTSKSQFLKYVHQFVSNSVYASGKASSAAGLTASVVKDQDTGEFCVEAGALMLADNGICCIDEFDKMDMADQVAIHEAMEQQTISITKAGIQATLNARTSILAAANPVFGRYDRTKTLKANVAVSAPIMSRFDLFFIVLDELNRESDLNIARHIIRVHQGKIAADGEPAAHDGHGIGGENARHGGNAGERPFTMDDIRAYVRLAKTVTPVMEYDGEQALIEAYYALRQSDNLGRNRTSYRITVRQLESLIRLSEALARLHLDHIVRPQYIREAHRLLQKSIIYVEMEDVDLGEDDDLDLQALEREFGVQHRPSGPDGGAGPPGAPGDEDDDGDGFDAGNGGAGKRMPDSVGQDDGGQGADKAAGDTHANASTNAGADASGTGGGSDTQMTGLTDTMGEWSETQTSLPLPPSSSSSGATTEEQGSSTAAAAAAAAAAGATAVGKDPAVAEDDTKKPEKGKSREKLQISYEEYQNMKVALTWYVRNEEEQNETGVRWGDVVAWYLEERKNDIPEGDDEARNRMRRTVNLVIRRLVKHDDTFIVLENSAQKEDRMLRVHPSYL